MNEQRQTHTNIFPAERVLECPKCEHKVMKSRKIGTIPVDECPVCDGIWYDSGELKAALGKQFDYDRMLSRLVRKGEGHACPVCHGKMTLLEYRKNRFQVLIEHCEECRGFFLDKVELEQLFTLEKYLQSRTPSFFRPLPVFEHSNGFDYPILRHYRSFDCERSAEGLEISMGIYFFCLLTQSPVEVYNPRKLFPDWLLFLVGINMLVSIVLYLLPSQTVSMVFYTYGAVPAEQLSFFGLIRLLTYSFLHPSLGNALINMYIIWIFGDNVYDVFMDHGRQKGSLLFISFYLTLAAAAGFLHCIFFYFFGSLPEAGVAVIPGKVAIPEITSALIPLVGAGGIASGLLASYWKLFPKSRLFQNIFVFPVKITMPQYLGFWVLSNIMMAFFYDIPAPLSLACHLGGFAAGWLLLDYFLPYKSKELQKKG
ncbi:MAG: rhomboid family intramembrane serine protease [Candidatus Wallbacteria bacterium]|nr:rhomboid family intramembrane serine protease [Candidatus Wallbacteria bacterium]